MLLKLPIITVNEVLRMGGGNLSSIWLYLRAASRFLGTGLTRAAPGRAAVSCEKLLAGHILI